MRTVIVSNIVSVDGYVASADGDFAVFNMDAAFDAYNLERIRSAGTVLLGRTSFELFGSYWPSIADAPVDSADRAVDEVNREISRIYNRLEKVVVSDTLVVPADHPWASSTTIVPRAAAGGWVDRARGANGGDIVVFGSATTWQRLLADGHVDELHLMVSPWPVTAGTPAFPERASLRLLGTREFPGSDNVLLRYSPAE